MQKRIHLQFSIRSKNTQARIKCSIISNQANFNQSSPRNWASILKTATSSATTQKYKFFHIRQEHRSPRCSKWCRLVEIKAGKEMEEVSIHTQTLFLGFQATRIPKLYLKEPFPRGGTRKHSSHRIIKHTLSIRGTRISQNSTKLRLYRIVRCISKEVALM